MCRFFLPSGKDTYVLIWLALTTAHVLFKNTMPKVETDFSSNFDFHIVRAGTHGVFPSALIEKKKKTDRPHPGAHS